FRLTFLLRIALHAERRVAGLDQASERLHERREVERPGRADTLVEERLERDRVIVRLPRRRRHRAIAGERGTDLGVELADRLARARVGGPRRGEPAQRHLDVARPDLSLLA